MRFWTGPLHVRAAVRGWCFAALVLLVATGPATARAAERDRDFAVGHVYVLDNNLTGTNSITIFARTADGALHAEATTPIGGLGSVTAFLDGTQGSLIRTPNGSRLFAVDAGSDQISVLDTDDDGGLRLRGVFPSGGAGPVSLSYHDGLLYVLNAANPGTVPTNASANVAGFRVDGWGGLHPIPGATKPLSTAHPNPAQVQLSPDGRELIVTEKSNNLIDLYRVAGDGSLSGPTTVPSVGNYPFGIAFDPTHLHELLVDDGFSGAVTAYQQFDMQLRLVDGPVPDFGVAPCWIVITGDGRFAYVSNADSFSISGYRIHSNATISLLDPNGVTATTPRDTFPIEEALSRDSQFLYVLDSRLLNVPPGPAALSGFRIGDDGHLTAVVDPASISLPFSAIGLTAI